MKRANASGAVRASEKLSRAFAVHGGTITLTGTGRRLGSPSSGGLQVLRRHPLAGAQAVAQAGDHV
ncbi:MAG: hypothetical protein WCJ64_25485, partial [Rhodospirillaceae bacterium]